MTFFNFLKPFFVKTPLKVIILIVCIIVAGALEGIGFALFIPLIRAITSSPASLAIAGEDFIDKFFRISGLQNSLLLLLGFIVLAVAAKNVFLYYERIFTAKISVDFEADLKKTLSSTVFACDWQFYLNQKVGTLINAFGISASKSAMAFQVGAQLCAEVLNIIIYSSIGLLISWQVFTLSMLAGLLYVYFSKNIIKVSRSLGQEGVDTESRFQSNILEDFTGMKFIKGNNIEKERKDILTSLIEQLKRVAFRRERYTALLDTLPESVMVGIMCLIFYFAFKFFKVPGENLLVMLMVLYRFNRRMMAVQTLRQRLINYLPAYELCDTIMHQARRFEECTGQRTLAGFESEIVFNEVEFAYNSQPVLASTSFRIKKNEFVAFVGKSGSGKTTILDLITGLLKSQKGAILVDGRPIGEYNIFLWRKILGYVPQEAFLIHGSVLENIQMANPNATEDDAIEAAKTAHADEFIRNLPDGYNTLVGDRGIKLSGGQRQRIALARAIVRNPQILILDEATSALDYDSESMVQKAINELKGKLTIIVVAHRLKTIEKADVIHVLDHGKIVSSGTMDELEKTSVVFKHIYLKK